jgi:hypothetical protein
MLTKVFIVAVIVYCIIGAFRHLSGMKTDKELKKLLNNIDISVK